MNKAKKFSHCRREHKLISDKSRAEPTPGSWQCPEGRKRGKEGRKEGRKEREVRRQGERERRSEGSGLVHLKGLRYGFLETDGCCQGKWEYGGGGETGLSYGTNANKKLKAKGDISLQEQRHHLCLLLFLRAPRESCLRRFIIRI